MTKTLEVPFLQGNDQNSSVEKISLMLDQQARQVIGCAPWPAFSYKPEVSFAIVHGNNSIFLKFFVEEESVRSKYLNTNDPVYKDSCVEFFICFNEEPDYYNFEFNCAGTCLLGFGKDRKRAFLPADRIKKIKHETSVKIRKDQQLVYWELTLIIPLNVFIHHTLTNIEGLKTRSNFFKCGDDLPRPHYLAWNDIKSDAPNFHLPEFFGHLNFR